MPNNNEFNFEKSDWNLAVEHQKRYSLILYEMNRYSFKVNNGHYEYCNPLWSSLKELWDEWRARAYPTLREKADNTFNYCKLLITKQEADLLVNDEFNDMIRMLFNIKQFMMELMNKIGLGMPSNDDEEEEENKDSEVYNDL